MNKQEFIATVAGKLKSADDKPLFSQKQIDEVLSAVLTTVAEELHKGEKVQFTGFGTFEVRVRGERSGRNPATGEMITIAASKTPAFKPGKKLKDAI